MSRLLPGDIKNISRDIAEYDEIFKCQTGKTMDELCREIFGIKSPQNFKTAVVPITSGLGTIERFSASVCDILRHIGADAFVTGQTDVFGFQEAYLKNAELIFAADDNAYVSFSTTSRVCSDNGYATGTAFAAALNSAANCSGKTVLVLGAGPVGAAACEYLSGHSARVEVYDPVSEKPRRLENRNIAVLCELPNLCNYKFILDATPVGGWITEKDVCENAVYSVPGMPLSLTPKAAAKITLIHNPLELGTIAMYYDCISRME